MANDSVEMRTSHVLLRMKFSMPAPPKYMRGEKLKNYLEERAWVSNDFIDYAARDGKYAGKAMPTEARLEVMPDKGNYLDYVSRQGTFESKGVGSSGTGVWGAHGELSGAELERVKQVFRTTKGNIWHGIISPTKELGDEMLDSKEKAMEFTKACFTRFLSSTHLRADNIEWYAGWHDDSASGIKHIQFAFCEKGPHIGANGNECYTKRGAIRKSTLADALISFEEYFSGHRDEVYFARDDLISRFRSADGSKTSKSLAADLLNLSRSLPKVRGHAGYKSEEYAPYRERIDAITSKMLREIPELNASYIRLMSAVSERERRFNETAKQFTSMQPTDEIAELRADIRARMGNAVIAFARRVDWNDRLKNYAAVQSEKEEKLLRRRQQAERKRDLKRFGKLFNEFYRENKNRDLVAEYYEEIEWLQYGENAASAEKHEN